MNKMNLNRGESVQVVKALRDTVASLRQQQIEAAEIQAEECSQLREHIEILRGRAAHLVSAGNVEQRLDRQTAINARMLADHAEASAARETIFQELIARRDELKSALALMGERAIAAEKALLLVRRLAKAEGKS